MRIDLQVAIGVLLVADGLFLTYFGYKYLKILLGVLGFLISAWFVFNWMSHNHPANATTVFLSGLAGLMGGVLFAYPLYVLGIGLQGSLLGYLLVLLSGHAENTVVTVVSLGLGGAIALLFRRPVLVVATALHGAFSILLGLHYMLETSRPTLAGLLRQLDYDAPVGFRPILFWTLFAFFCVSGMFTQWWDLRREARSRAATMERSAS